MVAEPQSPGLIRALGLWDVTAITAVTILRSAIFVAAAFVPRAVPHPTLALLLWVAGRLQGAALFIGKKQLRRGVHRTVGQLKTATREFIATYDATPEPFTWTKTADEILATIARFPQRTLDSDRATYSANQCGQDTGVLRTIPQNGLRPV
jgi:hypothetical protein